MNKFWMVHGPVGTSAANLYWFKEEALSEAKRLAKQHPGTFFVMEAVSAIEQSLPVVVNDLLVGMAYPPDESIPF